ncbi:unnamed protein product [Gongylonema pulchrum]|uniref:Secreted protein n=1 Tax=Gongylonema pulchrum TaxID=637853 RepID=A0A183EHQ2_9BILA|nr:unnamed protein product [Gongylonema pulchrum]
MERLQAVVVVVAARGGDDGESGAVSDVVVVDDDDDDDDDGDDADHAPHRYCLYYKAFSSKFSSNLKLYKLISLLYREFAQFQSSKQREFTSVLFSSRQWP